MKKIHTYCFQNPVHTFRSMVRLLLCCAAPLWLCSCASTTIKQTWKSPEFRQPVGKTAVLAIEDRGLVRQGLENRFVKQLGNEGITAITTFDQLSLAEIKEDRKGAGERFRSAGASSLLLLRLVDSATYYREIQPGGERYAAMVTGIDTMMWYDYYAFSVGFMNMSPTYGTLKQKVFIEASLYDLATAKRLWSALARTTVKENMDKVAEMDPLIAKFVAAMRQDGVIP